MTMITAVSKLVLVLAFAFFSPAVGLAQAGEGRPEGKVKFALGGSALNIPIEVDNNLILIRASVNGKPAVRLIFDTAASHTAINADIADALGLKGTERASGTATGGKIEGTMASGVTIGLKGAEVFDQPVGIFAMPRISGFDFDGVIGFDFINSFVVEIDYVNKVMHLYDRASYRYRGKGAVMSLILEGRRTPQMNASFLFGNGQRVAARLELDTGGDGAFVLNDPFVAKHRLLKTSKDLAMNQGRGVGGETERLLGKATSVRFGPFVFRDVPVHFSLQKEGLDHSTDGIVGGEVLRRFKVIIDYSRRHIILEANKSLKEPFEVEG